ncbi:MAG: TIGR04282 family arsenosugar biosynthesis glycosyltransferase [Gammaproteobacteria bacterium]
MKYPDCRLLIFSRAPQPGQVKTRLIPLLGETATADLYADLVTGTLEKLTTAGLCPVDLWCSPDTGHPFFQQCRDRFGVELYRQSQGDLGRRMSNALAAGLQRSAAVILVGTDIPSLKAGDIAAACAALTGDSDTVLGPAVDGGYYLIGLRTHHAALFEGIPWGTPGVFQATLACMHRLKLHCHQLPRRRDLDTPEDYHWHTRNVQTGEFRKVLRR